MGNEGSKFEPEYFQADSDGVKWTETEIGGRRALIRRDGLIVHADKDGHFQTYDRERTIDDPLDNSELDEAIKGTNERLKVASTLDAKIPNKVVTKTFNGPLINLKPIESSNIQGELRKIGLVERSNGDKVLEILFEAKKIGKLAQWFDDPVGDFTTLRITKKRNLYNIDIQGLVNNNQLSNLPHLPPTLVKFLKNLPEEAKTFIEEAMELSFD